MRNKFHTETVDAVLLVDASNAFNSLNREAALHNVQYICPSISTALANTYRVPSDLLADSVSLSSEEGTTQADPFAIPFYALATIPLIRQLDGAGDVK